MCFHALLGVLLYFEKNKRPCLCTASQEPNHLTQARLSVFIGIHLLRGFNELSELERER